ncbi:Spc98 family-domain-containing protein [Entophlyctis helioformis]|nr:Spc98 family-domain-containing protein [Entophlyctis helioformis]
MLQARRKQQQQQQPLEALVQRVTGLQLGSENHTACVQYAAARIARHAFLETDDKRVAQRCHGLAEKYSLHGDQVKATALTNAITALESMRQTHSQSSYLAIFDVVALLLHLSVASDPHEYEPPAPGRGSPGDDADTVVSWKQICAEEPLRGEHWFPVQRHRSPTRSRHDDELSDWALSDDDEQSRSSVPDRPLDADVISSAATSVARFQEPMNPMDHPSVRLAALDLGVDMSSDEYELFRKRQYWDAGRVTHIQDTAYHPKDPNTLRPAIATCESQSSDHYFRPLSTVHYVTEMDVVRECLFVLQGMPSTMFKQEADGSWSWLAAFSVSHLSDGALASLVNGDILPLANDAETVRAFTAVTLDRGGLQTLCAFASSVDSYMADWRNALVELELDLLVPWSASPELPVASLIWLIERIRPLSVPINLIAAFLGTNRLQLQSQQASRRQTATRLLGSLYDTVLYYQLQNETRHAQVFVEMLVASLQPLLSALDHALMHGLIPDPFDEFFLESESDIYRSDPTFWGRCCRVSDAAAVPVFMRDSAETVVHAIKIAMLTTRPLGVSRDGGQYLTDAFNAHLGRLSGFMVASADSRSPLDAFSHRLVFSSTSLARPFDRAMLSALSDALAPHLAHSHSDFVQLAFTAGRLRDHLAAMHSVFLFLSSDVMSVFSDRVFAKMDAGLLRKSGPMFLQTVFSETVLEQQLEDRIRLDAFTLRWLDLALLSAGTGAVSHYRSVFSNIRIDYDAPWPVSLIMDPGVVRVYNKVAAFVLTMGYARHSLQRAQRWKRGLGRQGREGIQLRMKLMHFVTSMQSYVMHGVLQAGSVELLGTIEAEPTMDAVGQRHADFVGVLADRLFLTDRAAPILQEIHAVFDLCIELDRVMADAAVAEPGLSADARSRAGHQPHQHAGRDLGVSHAAVARLGEMERQVDDVTRFLVEGLTVMAAQAGVAVEILALLIGGHRDRF